MHHILVVKIADVQEGAAVRTIVVDAATCHHCGRKKNAKDEILFRQLYLLLLREFE